MPEDEWRTSLTAGILCEIRNRAQREAVKKSMGQTAAPGRAIAFSGIWRMALKSIPDFFTPSEQAELRTESS